MGKGRKAMAVKAPPSCFLKGTEIRTVRGDCKVEDLKIGDRLPTASGGARPVQWISHRRYTKSNPAESWTHDLRPIRVARSALADGVPNKDLYLTPAHALFIDGVLVTVGSLINGSTITEFEARELDELEYFHVKFESHDVIYAAGAPCETLLSVNESAQNFADYYRRYGMDMAHAKQCARLLGYNGKRSELRSRFRSAISPWMDRRERIDIIRDRLEERGLTLCRHLEAV